MEQKYMTRKSSSYLVALLTFIFGVPACSMAQSSAANGVKNVKELDASKRNAFYSLDADKKVNEADSSKLSWDIALLQTTVRLGAGTSVIILDKQTFDKVTTAPTDGYIKDKAAQKAIPKGSGNGWYDYDRSEHTISPVPGRIFIFRTAKGKYAKLEFLSYYKDGGYGETGFYTFRYAFIKAAKKTGK